MKYVSGICDRDGKKYRGIRYGLVDSDRFKITETELETGRVRVTHDIKDIIGRGREFGSASLACAVHSEEAAKFCQYVEYLGDSGLNGEFDTVDLINGVGQFTGSDYLKLRISNDTLLFAGENGSVVTYMNPRSGQVAILALYDLLVRLCRLHEVNIMGYKSVQFYSTVRPYIQTLRFIHNKEADRFFLKTFLLAGRE